MAMNRGNKLKLAIVLALVSSLFQANATRHGGLAAHHSSVKVFDVTKYGAKGNGKPNYADTGESMNGLAMVQAWQEACYCKGPSTVLIPKGTYVVAQVVFAGPCKSHVTVELQGDIIPDPDIGQFPNNELFVFQNVDCATFTGSGLIDLYHRPRKPLDPMRELDFFKLMPTVKFLNCSNSVLTGIRSTNAAAFHVLVAECHNISISNVNFDGSFMTHDSNNFGVYVTASSLVSVANSIIRTGDACVTIAPGSSDVSVTGVTCLAGQGISIGAQAYTAALDVTRVTVKNCTFKGTEYGARIFPQAEATVSKISNIIFEDLTMEGVQNPISVSQQFHAVATKAFHPTIVDVHFKNIRGTANTNKFVSLLCNPLFPCEGIEVADIHLNCAVKGLTQLPAVKAICSNVKVLFGGIHDGLGC